jgi:hypothetical protein
MSNDLHLKYSLFVTDFKRKLKFPERFSKNTQISNSMKIRPVGAELFHADRGTDGWTDGRTDRHDGASSTISQFCERA